jgi:hypothetical protein
LLARLLAARAHCRPARLNRGHALFTPQAFPQLSSRACAVLNTPLKDCDPETLRLVFSTFTQHINQVLSPEAGITDPQAILPNLWHRISTALADTNADASLSTTPEARPATPADVVPNAPIASPDPPAKAPPTEPTRQWTNLAPRLSPLPLSGPPASDQPANATITTATPEATPEIAPSAPVVHRSRSRSFRNHIQSFLRWHRLRLCPPLFPRSLRHKLQCFPPPWRLYYAACTGPP